MPAGNTTTSPAFTVRVAAVVAAELHLRLAARDPQYLMGGGVEVQEAVDAVAPGVGPAMGREQRLV